MQQDTSPHQARVAGTVTRMQTASLVLCYSRMIFFQHYPRFTLFECKAFLAQAIDYFRGSAGRCMVDNSNVVVACGSGATMIPAPETAAVAARYDFVFVAHEKGDANRSARVEAPFQRIEKGFWVGEHFAHWSDLNQRARATCEAWNAKYSTKLHASRGELLAAEQVHLRPLPLHVPEVYQLCTRIVDAEGYVNVNRVRYSAPYRLIGRALEVRETLERVVLYEGPRRGASHARGQRPWDTRVTDPSHRPPRGQGLSRPRPESPQQIEILQIPPPFAGYVQAPEPLIAQLLRAEWHARQEQALQARIDRANFPEDWTLESFPFKMQKGIKERQIRAFAELEFIPKAENIVFIGETGVGKTGLMISLARKAVQNGYRALFIKAQDLLDEMYASLADRSTRRLLKSLANVDILAIDELGYVNIKPEQTNIFFKLMEERHHRKPTLITTNLPYATLTDFLANPALTKP